MKKKNCRRYLRVFTVAAMQLKCRETGLGLFICKRLMSLMGGEVYAEIREKCFCVTLVVNWRKIYIEEVTAVTDKKALTLLKKYYLPYTAEGTLSESDRADAFKSGILVPDSAMTHDEIITAIKSLSEDISLESTAKAFLYSLSSGDMRYRTALSSLVWARSLPKHEFISNNAEKAGCARVLFGMRLYTWAGNNRAH